MGTKIVLIIGVIALLALSSYTGEKMQDYILSQDFQQYFGQKLPLTPDARATVEPAVTRELFKARFELEQSNRYNLAKLGGKFFDLCDTAQRAGFEKEVEAANCFQPIKGVP